MTRYTKKRGIRKYKSNLLHLNYLVSVILFGILLLTIPVLFILRFITPEGENLHDSIRVEPLYTDSFMFPNTSKMNPSYRDRRIHRFTELPNGLRAVVISEPGRFRSSIAVNVAIGSAHDPVTHMGLAHLLEHMIFLGTKKYPESNYFGRYVQVHGGQYNAFTGLTDSTFYYKIPNQYLEQSLDMFGQLFSSALLDKKYLQREIGVLNEELQVFMHRDGTKLERLLRYVSNRNHTFFKFSCGSFDTLEKKDIHRQLKEFYQELYSSHLVSLNMKYNPLFLLLHVLLV